MAPLLLFAVGTCIALIVNYPVLKDQTKRIGDNAGDAVQVVILVFAAGIFMGLFQGSGMASALAQSFATIIPKQLAGFWGLVIALISAPGTFFISRSEEHTSELQSRQYLVCRLLLEKKKKDTDTMKQKK